MVFEEEVEDFIFSIRLFHSWKLEFERKLKVPFHTGTSKYSSDFCRDSELCLVFEIVV